MIILLVFIAGATLAYSAEDSGIAIDGDQSRKILGSSVVTSVSVIMDSGNGSKAVYTDAVGKPIGKPASASELASPINLLNPDRYEFYTFDDNGDLIKRLMSIDEIRGIIATGDTDGLDFDSFTSQGYLPEKKVNEVVNNVQNVLKEEMETHKINLDSKPMYDTPDVSDSWSMILPAVFGNSGENIKLDKPITHVTPDTIMIEPDMQSTPNKLYFLGSTINPHEGIAGSTPRSSTRFEQFPSTTVSELGPGTTQPIVAATPNPGKVTEPNVQNVPDMFNPTDRSTLKPYQEISESVTSTTKSITPSESASIVDIGTSQSAIIISEQNGPSTLHIMNLPVNNTLKPYTEISGSTTSFATTVKSTTVPELPSSTKQPFVVATPSQISTADKIITLEPGISTEKTLSHTNVTTTKEIPKLNVHIYSNSKPSTEVPIIQHTPTVEIKPTNASVSLTNPPLLPTTNFVIYSTDVITEQPPPTLKPATLEETTSSTTVSTTKLEIPESSEFSSNNVRISTWQTTEPSRVPITEQSSTKMSQFSTWRPVISSSNFPVNKTDPAINQLPTLAELLHMNKNAEHKDEEFTTMDTLTTFSALANDKTRKPSQTEYYANLQTTAMADSDDLSTLGSEYVGLRNNMSSTQFIEQTTPVPSLGQVTSTSDKTSASELLDQLLFTTNIYEINNGLAVNTTSLEPLNDGDQRFELNIQEQQPASIPDSPATEPFLIKINDSTEQPTTDRTLIESIEQLLSQAVNNVEQVLVSVSDTQKIQDILHQSENKTMNDFQLETATLASNMIGEHLDTEHNLETSTIKSTAVESSTSDEFSISNGSVSAHNNESKNQNSTELTPMEILTTTIKSSDQDIIIANTEYHAERLKVDSTTPFSINTTKIDYENLDNNRWEHINISKPPAQIEDDDVPHFINITILSSENLKSGNKSAKPNVSLEQTESEETYIEKNPGITESFNEMMSTDRNIMDMLKPEGSNINVENNTDAQTDLPENNNSSERTTTTEKLIKTETTAAEEKPTTIVIIKRTERPPVSEMKAVAYNKQNKTTTFTNLQTQITSVPKSVTEKFIENRDTTMYELIKQKFSDVEPTTQMVDEQEPYFEIFINENTTSKTDNADNSKLETSVTGNVHKPANDTKYIENQSSSSEETVTPYKDIIKISGNKNRSNKTDYISINGIPSDDITFQESTQFTNSHTTISNIPDATNNSTIDNINKTDTIFEAEPGSTWTLLPTIAPHSEEHVVVQNPVQSYPEIIEPPAAIDLVAKPLQGFGLEDTTSRLDADIYQFAQLCNELAFGFWKTLSGGLSSARSVFVSPFGATSLLAMIFLGARGSTSGEMNEILKLDDMVTFNPHLIFKDVTESIHSEDVNSGVVASTIIRELFSDRSKGKLLHFYKERAKAFYDGFVEEVSFREIGDVIRRRTNLLVKKYTGGRILEFLKDSSIMARSPLAGVGVNLFQTDCSQASTNGRDGELHFVVLPSIRQRRLIPIPAVVYKSGFLAGYEPSLDATAVSFGAKDKTISTIFVIPGQQGMAAPGDGLPRLEKRLIESSFKKGAWSRLLRSLIPRSGLEVQIPRFSHKSIINATFALKRMGLHDLFDIEKSDLRGLNGVPNDLFLSDMLQINSFATCGERLIGETHHSEVYPASTIGARSARYLELYHNDGHEYKGGDLIEEPRDYQRAFHDPLHDPSYLSLPLPLRPRQARIPETPRLRFDRPFLYFVRHNPTGLILHMGRFNPRLLP